MKKGKIASINPATLAINREITTTPVEDVKEIVESARESQKRWAEIGFAGRNAYFRKLQNHIMGNIDRIARVITLDNGKPLLESVSAEVLPVLDMLNFCVKEAPRALRDEHLSNPMFRLARIKSRNIYEPLGVVAIIAPWNFPFCIPTTQILMALATGNAVVVKPAAMTAYIGDLIDKLFKECGFPEGVVNIVQGSGSVLGDAILAAGVNRVAFTGSVPVGKHLMKKAGETLTPITLELGGKDPFIVLEDADLQRASSGAV